MKLTTVQEINKNVITNKINITKNIPAVKCTFLVTIILFLMALENYILSVLVNALKKIH